MKIPTTEILEFWHVSRTALADSEIAKRHKRMLYVQGAIKHKYPTVSLKEIWLQIEEAIS